MIFIQPQSRLTPRQLITIKTVHTLAFYCFTSSIMWKLLVSSFHTSTDWSIGFQHHSIAIVSANLISCSKHPTNGNLLNPLLHEQDDISHQDNPEAVLLEPKPRCVAGCCGLEKSEVFSHEFIINEFGFECPTFTRDVSCNNLPTGKLNPRGLSFSGIGLLWLFDLCLQAHSFQLRPVYKSRRSLLSCLLARSAASSYLIQRSL